MVTIAPRLIRFGAFLLLSAAASLSSGSASADLTTCTTGSVCYYVAIQPIDVCTSTGTGCAPFNNLSKTGNPGAATSTTPIGFVDSGTGSGNTGKDITRAIWNQTGVDIAWAPIKQYNNTTFQTLKVVPCANTNPLLPCASIPGALTSTDFLTLSQQTGVSTGTVPNPTNPVGVPVSSQPTMINMFFVSTLAPPVQGQTLYGFSWIKNNGIAISANTFNPLFPLTPRYDTIAHEIGHNLGLDHLDQYNYGCNAPGATCPPADLMTAGNTRTEPKNTADALTQLRNGDGTGTADQLDCATSSTSTQCDHPTSTSTPQQGQVALSGLLNPIANSTTTATPPGGDSVTTSLVVSNTAGDMTTITAAPNSTKPNTSIFFDVTGPVAGQQGETLVGLILTLGKGLHFDPTNKVSYLYGSDAFVVSSAYDHGNTGDANCPDPATQCLVIQLKNPGVPASQFFDFSQGIVGAPGQVGSSAKTVALSDILSAGANVTYKFSDGLIITSTLAQSGCCRLTASSQFPSSTVPAQIDPNLFVSIPGAKPCTVDDSGFCPDPTATPVGDGDPNQEGGQLPSGGG
jgi:hypothetical protein